MATLSLEEHRASCTQRQRLPPLPCLPLLLYCFSLPFCVRQACDINTMNNIRSFLSRCLPLCLLPPSSCLCLYCCCCFFRCRCRRRRRPLQKPKGLFVIFLNKIFFISLLRCFSCNLRKTNKKRKMSQRQSQKQSR